MRCSTSLIIFTIKPFFYHTSSNFSLNINIKGKYKKNEVNIAKMIFFWDFYPYPGNDPINYKNSVLDTDLQNYISNFFFSKIPTPPPAPPAAAGRPPQPLRQPQPRDPAKLRRLLLLLLLH
jgi:hypothetical protein